MSDYATLTEQLRMHLLRRQAYDTHGQVQQCTGVQDGPSPMDIGAVLAWLVGKGKDKGKGKGKGKEKGKGKGGDKNMSELQKDRALCKRLLVKGQGQDSARQGLFVVQSVWQVWSLGPRLSRRKRKRADRRWLLWWKRRWKER